MECPEALELLSAQMDQAMASGDRARLEAHLNGCASCRATTEALRQQDAELKHAFTPRRAAASRLAERAYVQIRGDIPRRGHRRSVLPWLIGLAAGFLLAVIILAPWSGQRATPAPTGLTEERLAAILEAERKQNQEHVAGLFAKGMKDFQEDQEKILAKAIHELAHQMIKPEVQLALATGLVETKAPGADAWRPLKTGSKIEPGSRVRTSPQARCELQVADGSAIRLNGGSELVLAGGRQLELTQGQMWARVARDPVPFQVQVPQATVTALGTEFDLLCAAAATTLTVLEGKTLVKGERFEEVVATGESARIVGGGVTDKQQRKMQDLVAATRWVHELLFLKGRDDKELSKRVDDIFAQLGDAKMSDLTEKEIRSLGDHGVLPLTRFLQSPRSDGERNEFKRDLAARIVGDLAQPWSIPDLISLLDHADGDVRYHAARALLRLTSETQGKRPEDWRTQAREALRPAVQQWQDWWRKNKGRYPGAG